MAISNQKTKTIQRKRNVRQRQLQIKRQIHLHTGCRIYEFIWKDKDKLNEQWQHQYNL